MTTQSDPSTELFRRILAAARDAAEGLTAFDIADKLCRVPIGSPGPTALAVCDRIHALTRSGHLEHVPGPLEGGEIGLARWRITPAGAAVLDGSAELPANPGRAPADDDPFADDDPAGEGDGDDRSTPELNAAADARNARELVLELVPAAPEWRTLASLREALAAAITPAEISTALRELEAERLVRAYNPGRKGWRYQLEGAAAADPQAPPAPAEAETGPAMMMDFRCPKCRTKFGVAAPAGVPAAVECPVCANPIDPAELAAIAATLATLREAAEKLPPAPPLVDDPAVIRAEVLELIPAAPARIEAAEVRERLLARATSPAIVCAIRDLEDFGQITRPTPRHLQRAAPAAELSTADAPAAPAGAEAAECPAPAADPFADLQI